MTTESKSIGQSYVHFALLCFVEREVQVIVDVFVVITLFVVEVGGTMPFLMARMLAMDSTAPAAPANDRSWILLN